VLGPCEALLGQLVAPDLVDALDERVEIEPVGREEQRAVDVEKEKRYTATVASRADRSDAT
jgi:hypothetical protein